LEQALIFGCDGSASAGAVVKTTIAAIIATAMSVRIVRLNVATDIVVSCCCPIMRFLLFLKMGLLYTSTMAVVRTQGIGRKDDCFDVLSREG
jgi:hypothetical protein